MTGFEMVEYTDLAGLLRAWRDYHELTQIEVAHLIGHHDDRTVRRWESTSGEHISAKWLEKLPALIGIPFAVLNSLNGGDSVYYSLRKKRYAMSYLDGGEVVPDQLRRPQLDASADLERWGPIKSEEQTRLILAYDHQIYQTKHPARSPLLRRAAELLPELNLFRMDRAGCHVGHMVCLPLRTVPYQRLKSEEIVEGDLEPDSLASIGNASDQTLYFYSVYGASQSIAVSGLLRARRQLSSARWGGNRSIAGYAVTRESIEICAALGMIPVYSNPEEHRKLRTEVIPQFFEGTVGAVTARLPGLR